MDCLPFSFEVVSEAKLARGLSYCSWFDFNEDGNWNKGLIRENFNPTDVVIILNIPLSIENKEDTIIWHYDKNGEYLVKSEYKVAMSMKERNDCSSSYRNGIWWKHLWKIQLLGKIIIFLWKACKGILPTRGTLYKYKVIKLPECLVYENEVEIRCPCLVDCLMANAAWRFWRVDGAGSISKSW